MINSGVFDYVNVLSKAADAAWERNELLVNNYSNANTPGYKRKDLDFSTQLREALGNSRYESVDAKVARAANLNIKAKVYTDSANFSYRLDGNNVDPDTEGVEKDRKAVAGAGGFFIDGERFLGVYEGLQNLREERNVRCIVTK